MSTKQNLAVGIDLGTTNACVAIWRNGRAEIIPNDVGERTTPSWVGFTDEQTLIGRIAKNLAHRNHGNTVFDVKRLMGKQFSDETVQSDIKNWPFTVVNRNGKPDFKVKFRKEDIYYCPEQISAIILDKLKEVASNWVETPVTKAVITVPAYFNNAQRQATKDAGELAQLEVLRLLNEPTAAAIAYAIEKNTGKSRQAIIFDLGGGTFDVSIVKFENRRVTVKAVDGDAHLGGADFDNRLLDYFASDIKKKFAYDIKEDRRALARLRTLCEKAKKLLSYQTSAHIELDVLVGGEDYEIDISRAQFEDLMDDIFTKTITTVRNCLRHASIEPKDIDDVVLVGGSTRIPKLRQMLAEFFKGKALSQSINPDEAVALGAAIHAAYLNNDPTQVVEDFEPSDVVPFSLGVETAGGLMSVLIGRNSPLPATATKTYTTAKAGQSAVNIKIFEGEERLTKDNRLLGQLRVNGIRPAPAGVPRIAECFRVDKDGILNVTAVERSSGQTTELDIVLDSGQLTKEEKRHMTNGHESLYQNLPKDNLKLYCEKTLQAAERADLTPPHRNYIVKKCNAAMAWLEACRGENEDELLQRLRDLKMDCDIILDLYKKNNKY